MLFASFSDRASRIKHEARFMAQEARIAAYVSDNPRDAGQAEFDLHHALKLLDDCRADILSVLADVDEARSVPVLAAAE